MTPRPTSWFWRLPVLRRLAPPAPPPAPAPTQTNPGYCGFALIRQDRARAARAPAQSALDEETRS